MAKPLNERLKEARSRLGRVEKKKVTQGEMARRVGVTQGAISLWENGLAVPRQYVDEVEREYGIRITRDDLLREAA